VPIYNADGNEKVASQSVNRTEQNGPALVGRRANGQGLDLNRDYIKAEAPETETALREALSDIIEYRADTLILGCTHYPMLKPLIKKIAGENMTVVTPAKRFSVPARQFRVGVHHENTAAALVGWRLKHNWIAKLRRKVRRFCRRLAEPVFRRGISSLTKKLSHLIFVGKQFGLCHSDARQPQFFAEIGNRWDR